MKDTALRAVTIAALGVMAGVGPVAVARDGKDTGQDIVCPETWAGNECERYKDGCRAGKADRKANVSMAYRRHFDVRDSRFEENYRQGYEDGWQGNRCGRPAAAAPPRPESGDSGCPEAWDAATCGHYKDGYLAGKSDRRANVSMAYERHAGAYDSRFEQAFRAGYEAGWKGEPH